MKAYLVYEYDYDRRNDVHVDVKVYKNEEDAKKFCRSKQVRPDSATQWDYKKIDAEGF